MEIDPAIIQYLVPGALALLFIWILVLEFRLRKIFRGASGGSLEGLIKRINEKEEALEVEFKSLKDAFSYAEKKTQKGISSVGVVKFNAFSESGGDQSFSVALLDRSGNGALISSLYTIERVSIYAKQVENYTSPLKLLPEERGAIMDAKRKKEVVE